jgi:hypothetical protein
VNEQDVSPLLKIINSSPEESAETIKLSSQFGVPAETGRMIKPQLQQAAKEELFTPMVAQPVADYVAQSRDHAAVINPELGFFDEAAKQVDFAMKTIKGGINNRRLSELGFKKTTGEALTAEEDFEYIDLREKTKNTNLKEEFGHDFVSSIPAESVNLVYDFGHGIWDGKDLVGLGAATGGLLGLTGLGVGAIPGAITGMIAGGTVASVRDTYQQSVGQVYNDLENINATDPLTGEKLIKAEDERRAIARGAGIMMASLDAASSLFLVGKGVKNVAKELPWFKKIMTPTDLVKHAMKPEGKVYLELLKSMGAEGGTEMAQQAIQIFAKQIGDTWDGTETKFQEGISTGLGEFRDQVKTIPGQIDKAGLYDALDKAPMVKELAQAGTLGAIGGATFDAGTRVTAKAVNAIGGKIRSEMSERQKKKITAEADQVINNVVELKNEALRLSEEITTAESEIDVTTNEDDKKVKLAKVIQLKGELKEVVDTGREIIRSHSDLTEPKLPAITKGTQTIQFKILIDKVSQLTKETKFNKLVPEERSMIVQKLFDDAGVSNVWVDRADFNEWANNAAKAESARKVLDPTGTAASQVNAPISISVANFVKLVDEHPSASNLAKQSPEAPNVGSWMKRLEAAKKNRDELMSMMPKIPGVDLPENAEPEANLNGAALLAVLMNDPDTTRVGTLGMDESKRVVGLAKRAASVETKKRGEGAVTPREAKLQEIIGILDTRVNKIEKLQEGRMRDEDIFNEADYLEQQTFTEAMYSIIPAEQVAKFNEAAIIARIRVSNSIKETAEKEMNKLIGLEEQRLMNQKIENEINTAERDLKVRAVEAFINNEKVFEADLTEFQKERRRKGKPVYSINPKTMSKVMQDKFKDNATLKKRSVFHKDGMDIDHVSSIFNMRPDEFMKIMSETPTWEELVEQRLENAEGPIRELAESNIELDEGKLAQAYNNMTKIHIKEMKILVEKYWPQVKKGFKLVAHPLPKLGHLRNRAKNIVGNTKIKDINPTQWKVAERKSQRIAVNAIVNNEVELAFREKTNAALASQITKESHIAIGKVNRAMKLIANLGSERVQKQLKDAGKVYQDAVNHLLDLYNFDPKQKGQSNIDAFNKYVKQMIAEGKGDQSIPESVQEWISTRESAEELTVDQIIYIADKLRTIAHTARLKNRLVGQYTKDGKEFVHDQMIEAIDTQSKKHPSYDSTKNIEAGRRGVNAVVDFIGGAEAFVKNIKALTDELDAYDYNGMYGKLIWQIVEGVGHGDGPYGLKARSRLQKVINDSLHTEIKAYGKLDFNSLNTTPVFVEEFKELPHLKNGYLVKGDLLQILMNMGNESNKARVGNFGMSPDAMMKVLQKYLEKRDFDFVQNFVWDNYRKLKPRLAAVHKATTGTDLDFIEPESFEAFGKTYEGGYFPVKLRRDTSLTAWRAGMEVANDLANALNKTSVVPHPAHEGFVRSPHTKERTDTDHVIDLDMNNLDVGMTEFIHDVTMRVPIRDVMQLITDKSVEHNIKSIVGNSKYNVLHNAIMGLTNSIGTQNAILYSQQAKIIASIFGHVDMAVAVGLIAGKLSTFVVNFSTVPKILHVMGPIKGTIHLTNATRALSGLMMNGQFKQILDWAGEIDTSIFDAVNDLNDFSESTFSKNLPKKRMIHKGAVTVKGTTYRPYHIMKNGQEWMNDFFMKGILGNQDLFFKVMTVTASYNQYLAGDVEGHPIEEINKMSDEERDTNAKAYAASISASLTMRGRASDKAPIQAIPQTKLFTRFFNELRSNINVITGEVRQIYWGGERFLKAVKEGDPKDAGKHFYDSTTRAMSMVFFMGMVPFVIQSIARGKNPFALDEEDEDNPIEWENAPAWAMKCLTDPGTMLEIGMAMGPNQTPILRDMLWASKVNKGVSTPFFMGLTGVASVPKGLMALGDELGLIDAGQELTMKEWKQVAHGISVLTGGFPVEGIFEAIKQFEDVDLSPGRAFPIIPIAGATSEFVNKYDESPEESFKRIQSESEKTELQEVVDQVKDVRDKLNPPDQTETEE